jgi:hypothetical protein
MKVDMVLRFADSPVENKRPGGATDKRTVAIRSHLFEIGPLRLLFKGETVLYGLFERGSEFFGGRSALKSPQKRNVSRPP